MVNFRKKPERLDAYFDKLFEASRRVNIEQCKLSIYDNMVRDERQIAAEREYAVEEARKETWAKAHEEGRAEGRAEGKIEMARGLKTAGIDIETISRCSGLSIAEVEAL